MFPEREIYTPEIGPPGPMPGLNELFSKWGEERIRNLVSRFYDRIPNSKIYKMFPKELTLAKQKQADFIIQILGGPAYYVQNWGPARMRMRHFPFPIDEAAREEWLRCFEEALEESDFEREDKVLFNYFLDSFSKWMVNQKT
ncbi:bacitracin resistance protein BacA [Leptospira idonii]|uniref:Bacitracin resistance protein BacA n=1 Tax=Leptospira idonii TaxID=1193500 RepID=A0A4R9LY37_9LEPT|nr:bacitracin resistance protein BacA [Leptospira idonii]TGN19264.1 bacitracin resistance protein BacA [Leptospira idonii]